MASSSLEHRTVRPGSLGSYSYYRSARRPDPPARTVPFITSSGARLIPRNLAVALVLIAALIAVPILRSNGAAKPTASQSSRSQTQGSQGSAPANTNAAAVTEPAKTDACSDNTLSKMVVVSIGQRHMWACAGSKAAYDSPVVTGMSAHASTITPTGTYHIYGKQTHLTLTGSDVTGSWSDPVSYWMPFLNNKYGAYGFHDATWRSNDEFGNISPDSSKASHGCVELPLATAKWLYGWVSIGTTVNIRD